MRRTVTNVLPLLALAAILIAVLALAIGARRQRRALDADLERLRDSGAEGAIAAADRALADLPAPVARYLRMALPSPQPIQEVRILQAGTLRTDATSARWMPFDAEHIVNPEAIGFVWNARVQVAPLLHVRVRDALIDGTGSGQVSFLSAIPMSAATGGLEMNSGSLHRYLAEAVWYPTALLPSSSLEWSAIDESRALATLTSRGARVGLEFRFAPSGEVTGIFTPGRWGTFPDGYRQVPWEGHFRDYRERHGVVVPTGGDVGWYIDGEWRAVWKGAIVEYEVRRRALNGGP